MEACAITFRHIIYMVMGYILLQRLGLHTGPISTWSWDTSFGRACHYTPELYLLGHGTHLVVARSITHRCGIYLIMGYILWPHVPLHNGKVSTRPWDKSHACHYTQVQHLPDQRIHRVAACAITQS